jgi:murein DD-endopeptidase MepM/ murein hydrolase activator NlpD
MQLQHSSDGHFSFRRLRRIGVATVVCASLLPLGSTAVAKSGLTSEQVASEIMRVQEKADIVAQRWAEAQIRSEELAAELAAAEDKLAATTAQYNQIEDALAQIAINRFTGSSATTMLVVLGDPVEQQQMDALLSIALDQGSTDRDQVDAVRSDLDKDRERVSSLRAENEQVTEQLASSQAEIEQHLAELATLQEQLKDEEVKRAYEAQLAKKRRDFEAQQAAAAAAAAEQAALAPAPLRGGGTQPDASSATTPPTQPGKTPTAANQPTTPTPEPVQPDSVANPEPAPRPAPVISSASGWICPVAGPTAFGDTWGAPRPGGRTHQGVDMMSPAGTPLVAVVAGNATMRTNTLGGNVISLAGSDGNGYYYAHLSAWEGSSRSVNAGEIIGYVGATGNTTANHLHFEIHPGGGSAVNPYPTVRQFC